MLLWASFRPLPAAQASTSDSDNCRGWCRPLVTNKRSEVARALTTRLVAVATDELGNEAPGTQAARRGVPPGRALCLLDLDLDVHARGQVEALQRVDGLGAVLHDVEQPLVDAHLEVLAAVLVLVGRADHRVAVLLGRQRHRPAHLGLRPDHRLHDLLRGLVDDLVVVGLEPDPDLLLPVGHGYLTILTTRPAPTVRPPSRMAKRRPSSMAIGLPSSTVIVVLSPGMTISVPSGSVMEPVTSVVRK